MSPLSSVMRRAEDEDKRRKLSCTSWRMDERRRAEMSEEAQGRDER